MCRIRCEVAVAKFHQPEEFEEYDLAANIGLPWQRYSSSGWGVGTQLMASVGIMRNGGDNGLVGSLIPIFALGSDDVMSNGIIKNAFNIQRKIVIDEDQLLEDVRAFTHQLWRAIYLDYLRIKLLKIVRE